MTVRILTGDVFEQLATLPDESVHCCVTSPPYWGLRDYGVAGQIGLEPTLSEHLDVMVRVFAEVWRVLRDDGTLWLNYGDCYATNPNGRSAVATKAAGNDDRTFRDKPFSTVGGMLKPKDLCMIPNRLAIALQEWGWWVRSEIIWAKANPMPESVTDRPTSAHEKIWLLAKSAKYWYDADAVRTESTAPYLKNAYSPPGQMPHSGALNNYGKHKTDKQRGHGRRHAGFNDRWGAMSKEEQAANGANLRNVWNIATRAYPEAHFATFAPEIPERCIKAGTSEKGCCTKCGTPYTRVVSGEKYKPPIAQNNERQVDSSRGDKTRKLDGAAYNKIAASKKTIGWNQSCNCVADIAPCTVLDPFGGAGTTGLVADRLNRNAILIELNPEYAEMARNRIAGDAPLFADVEIGEI